MLWNCSSVSCGPLWQSMHAALPTNRRAPRLAAAEMRGRVGPFANEPSKGESTLISLYS